jgi:hypothetical protein
MHGLADAKASVTESHTAAWHGFLHSHGALADRTVFSGFLGGDHHTREGSDLISIPLLHGVDLLPQ